MRPAVASLHERRAQQSREVAQHARHTRGCPHRSHYVIETADDAEVYLNTLVPDGYSFGWSDGEYFLANDAWWSLDS